MKHLPLILVIALLVLVPACNSPDARLARLAEQSSQQQAAQNQRMADVSKSAYDNHRRVVEAVEQSRQEVTALQREVRLQHDRLDEERRWLAEKRHRESLLAPVLETLGFLLVAALPLVVAIYLLQGLRGPDHNEAVSEVMLRELLDQDSPLRLNGAEPRRRIQQETVAAAPDEDPPF